MDKPCANVKVLTQKIIFKFYYMFHFEHSSIG